MTTFSWLLLAHLLSDWVLQNDLMARGKKNGLFTLAGALHFFIYTLTITGTLWLCGVRDKGISYYLLFGSIIFISHWLIDSTNGVERWMRFFRQSKLEVVRIMVDQVLHLLVLAVLTVILVGV